MSKLVLSSDNTIVRIVPDNFNFTFDSTGFICSDFIDPNTTTATHRLIEVLDTPSNIVPYAFKFENDQFILIDQAVLDASPVNQIQLAADIREIRNKILRDTDWTQCKDIKDSISAPWAIYRQQLRDITEQPEFPQNIQWPIPPQ